MAASGERKRKAESQDPDVDAGEKKARPKAGDKLRRDAANGDVCVTCAVAFGARGKRYNDEELFCGSCLQTMRHNFVGDRRRRRSNELVHLETNVLRRVLDTCLQAFDPERHSGSVDTFAAAAEQLRSEAEAVCTYHYVDRIPELKEAVAMLRTELAAAAAGGETRPDPAAPAAPELVVCAQGIMRLALVGAAIKRGEFGEALDPASVPTSTAGLQIGDFCTSIRDNNKDTFYEYQSDYQQVNALIGAMREAQRMVNSRFPRPYSIRLTTPEGEVVDDATFNGLLIGVLKPRLEEQARDSAEKKAAMDEAIAFARELIQLVLENLVDMPCK